MNEYLQKLAWDTEFFSVSIGRITAPVLDDETATTVLEDACKEGLRCLYFEVDPNDLTTVLTVEKHGFHLVDVRVILEYPACAVESIIFNNQNANKCLEKKEVEVNNSS